MKSSKKTARDVSETETDQMGDVSGAESDQNVTPVPEHLTGYLKTRIIDFLTETDAFSAEIKHIPGQNAHLQCSLGVKAATGRTHSDAQARGSGKTTNSILVKNLPSSVDADFLELFFESKKKQGGGPVKHVSLDKDKHVAVVEFEEPEAVEIVMSKRPLKMLDVTLQVQRHIPLLDESETVDRMEFRGLPTQLSDDIRKMNIEGVLQPPPASSSMPQELSTLQEPITSEVVGSYEGNIVYRYTLKNKNNVEVRILNYGGIITNIFTPDKTGRVDDIALGYDTFEEYTQPDNTIGILGRFANRIQDARFTLDDIMYNLSNNSGGTHIHGGYKGFNNRLWDSRIEDKKLYLYYKSADGEEGYPGKVWATATYELTDKNKLVMHYTARSSKPTIMNLSNHNYLNLAGQGAGSLKDHVISLAANKYLPFDGWLIPMGNIADVAGTKFDLTKETDFGKRLLEVPGKVGFDHAFCLESPGWYKHAARVRHPPSGRVLDLYTTKPGLYLYTMYYNDGRRGKGTSIYRKYGGFSLQATHYPNSPNQPNFPSPILRPGEEYNHVTVLKFSTEES